MDIVMPHMDGLDLIAQLSHCSKLRCLLCFSSKTGSLIAQTSPMELIVT
ncbi:hypothetical protein GC096_02305 [Paenibacillus sp. LMG 31461]|uniref:Response regulatory domain-containing protein n=1 Tax=Paenibacillus plantarum TaxID=2654975 RepID=A0ABX1X392_9BACL|nr:hypothetical protein [Paenibacillus plantarum]